MPTETATVASTKAPGGGAEASRGPDGIATIPTKSKRAPVKSSGNVVRNMKKPNRKNDKDKDSNSKHGRTNEDQPPAEPIVPGTRDAIAAESVARNGARTAGVGGGAKRNKSSTEAGATSVATKSTPLTSAAPPTPKTDDVGITAAAAKPVPIVTTVKSTEFSTKSTAVPPSAKQQARVDASPAATSAPPTTPPRSTTAARSVTAVVVPTPETGGDGKTAADERRKND